MTTFLDTNVLVRYIVDTPTELGKRAAAVIDSQRPLVISTVALAETAFVLTRFYEVPRAAAVDALVALLRQSNITVSELSKNSVVEALLLCRSSNRVSFANAIIWALARNAGAGVVTFDRRFPAEAIKLEVLS